MEHCTNWRWSSLLLRGDRRARLPWRAARQLPAFAGSSAGLALCLVLSVLPTVARAGSVRGSDGVVGAAGPSAGTAGGDSAVAPLARRLVLSNGLEVLLQPDPLSRLVTSIVVVRAGSNRETPRTAGAAHFLEHMLFNGTNRRTQKDLYDEVDAVGGFNNAFTRRTHAAFMLSVPAEELASGLDLHADMLFHTRLPLEKFEKERGVILEEMAKDREGQTYDLERILEAETYPYNSYGLPVLGTEASLASLQRSEVYAHYRGHYVPQNMVAVLLGGFDPDAVVPVLERTLGATSPRGNWIPDPVPPAAIAHDRIVRHRLPLPRARLRVVWNGPDPAGPDFRAAQAAADLYLGGPASPLGQRLAERFGGAVQGIYAGLDAGPGFSRLVLDLDLAPGADLDAVRSTALASLADLPSPSPSRLAGWKTGRRAEQVFATQRSYMLAPLVSEDLALLGATGLETRLEQIESIDSRNVDSVFMEMVGGPVWSILVDAMPAEKGATALAGMPGSGMPAAGMPGGAAMAGGPGPLPCPVAQRRLDNGANLLVLAAPRDGSFAIYLLIEGRNYLEPSGCEGITEFLHNLLATGAGDLDEAAFQEAIDGIGGDLQTADRAFIPFDDYYSQRDFSFVRLQALDEHAERACDLLGRMLRQPRFDAGIVERERGRLSARLTRDAGSASAQAILELRMRLLGAGHPEAHSPFGSPEGVAAISIADLREHHRRLLGDPGRVWIAVATSRSPDQVAAWAERLLPAPEDEPSFTPEREALWAARARPGDAVAERWSALLAEVGIEPLAGESARVLRRSLGGERGHVLDCVLLPGAHEGPRAAADVAAGLLSARLAFHLREERGLAYGIGASITRIGGRSFYLASAGTRALQVAEMAAGMLEERRAVANAPDLPQECALTAAREAGQVLRRQETRLNQAMAAVWSAREGRGAEGWWSEAADLRSVEPAEIRGLLNELAEASGVLLVVE